MTDKERIKEFILNNKEQFSKWSDAAAEKNLHNTMEANNLLVGFCDTLLSLIDSMQEEPKFKVGQTIKKEGFNADFTITKIEDGFYYSKDGSYFPLSDQDNWEVVKIDYDELNSMLNDALSKETPETWNEMLGEEPTTEIDFEQELYNYFGQVKDFTLGMRIAKRFYDMGRKHQEPVSEDLEKEVEESWKSLDLSFVKDGLEMYRIRNIVSYIAHHFADWQKQKDSKFISDDLQSEIDSLSKRYPEVSFAKLSRIAVHIARWQESKMMNNAVEGYITAYPYADGIEIMFGGEHQDIIGKYKVRSKVKAIILPAT